MPPTSTHTSDAPSAVVTAAASPVTLTIPAHAEPLVLTITSAAAITVTGQSTSRPLLIQHTP
jgi:hypothetical protein